MFISNTQQLRNEFVRRSFENQERLTSAQFINSLAQDGIYISLLTASMVCDDFSFIPEMEEQVETAVEELALV